MALVPPHHGWTPDPDALVQPFHGAGRVAGGVVEPTPEPTNALTYEGEPITYGGESVTYTEA